MNVRVNARQLGSELSAWLGKMQDEHVSSIQVEDDHGNVVAVVVAPAAYCGMTETLAVMANKDLVQKIQEGQAATDAGEVVSLEDVRRALAAGQ